MSDNGWAGKAKITPTPTILLFLSVIDGFSNLDSTTMARGGGVHSSAQSVSHTSAPQLDKSLVYRTLHRFAVHCLASQPKQLLRTAKNSLEHITRKEHIGPSSSPPEAQG